MRLGNSFLVSFLVWLFLSIPTFAQKVIFDRPLSPRIANYEIDVRLDTEKRMLFGQEKLIWYNKTNYQIKDLQFHLYLNGFRNSKSTFMKESGGSHRGYKIDDDGWGYIEIKKVTLASGRDVTGDIEFIQPDDQNEFDKTVIRVPLPMPLKPGQSIQLAIEFFAKLPQPPFARSGAKEEFFFVGQWFPKIGVFSNGKWNCHQYHRSSEFFADFGVYDVNITVPEENIVGATGVEVEVIPNDDGTATHVFHAEDVHDFAWTTSPEYVEFKGTAQDVEIRVLMQKDHAAQGKRFLNAAKVAVEYFQDWYGDYPFPNLTVVDPRRGAQGAGGMEYPTLITALTFSHIPDGLRVPEMVIIHEFGHNFWYHLVASNEFEEAWLDEGINSFSECLIVDDYYGPVGSVIDLGGIKINDRQFQRGQYISLPDIDVTVQNSWDFYSFGSYGIGTYYKPSLMLQTLRNYLGKEVMQNIMRTYFERWKFKHPKTQDFVNVANEVSDKDLNWFFDQALYTNATLDYTVSHVFSRELKEDKGYDFTLSVTDDTTKVNKENNVSDSLDNSKDRAEKNLDSTERKKEKLYESGIYIRRLGDFIFPVEVEAVFADGDTVREIWDGKGLWKEFRYVKPVKMIYATVDPDSKIPIDINITNNSKTIKTQYIGVNKLSIRWLYWMQFLLDQPDFLNLFSIFANVN